MILALFSIFQIWLCMTAINEAWAGTFIGDTGGKVITYAFTIFFIIALYGGEITPEEIRARISEADAVYIRVDQNKANWVKGHENGSIDLW